MIARGPSHGRAYPISRASGVRQRTHKSRAHPEQDLQRAVVAFLHAVLPANAFTLHIPNGGKRSKREAAIMVGLGVMAGAADLPVFYDGRAFMLELKSQRGRPSKAQERFAMTCHAANIPWKMARSIEEVEAALRSWGIPMRGRLT